MVTQCQKWRQARSIVAFGLVFALVAGACGASTTAAPAAEPTTLPAAQPTTLAVAPTSSAPASWSSPDDIVTTAPEQVLPALEDLIAAIDAENVRLGATDGLRYDLEDQVLRVSVEEGPCTKVAFASFYYGASVSLTETPSVGILVRGVTAMVCADGSAATDEAQTMFNIADREQGTCPVDDVGPDGLGVRVCPVRPGAELRRWTVAAAGITDRVLVRITGDLGPDTDPQDGAQAFLSIVDVILGHIDDRLA